MRILYLTHYFPPEGNAPASRVYEMSKRWVRQGHEVTVITCAPNAPAGVLYPGYRNRLVQRERMDGIDVVRVWTYLAANKGTVRRIANYLSFMLTGSIAGLLVRRPDVMIATSPQFFCGWAGVLVRWFRRLPFILEIRDIWPEGIVAVGALSNKRLIRLLEALEVRMYRLAMQIAAVGEGYKSEIAAKGIDASKIAVITNGADLDVYYPREPDDHLYSALGLKGKFVCSYNGNIGMTSGLDIVLRAARLLRAKHRTDIQFILVGDGAVRKDLEDQARRSALDNVLFVGRQAKDAMPRFLSISDACLVHLKRRQLFKTTLPSKMFEAMAMGRAVVLGVEGCAAEILQDADGGICIEPENEHALAAALESLADNDERRAAYGRNGYEHVRRFYNRDVLARKYISVMEKVIEAASTRDGFLKSERAVSVYDSSEKAGRFFGGYAEQFDEIYALQKQRGILGWLNRRLRASMLLRYEGTFDALSPMEGRSVLDVGCGSGRYVATSLANGASRVVGIDLSEEMLVLARQAIEQTKAFEGKAHFVCGDFLTHTFDEQYDYGIVMGVMDYIDDPAVFVGKLSRVIRCKAALSFPVAESLWTLQRTIRYRRRNCPLFFYRRDQLERLLADSPFAAWSIRRIRRDYFVVVSH